MVLPPDVWLDTDELQRKLAKKYPVDSVRLRMSNPHEPGISLTAVVVLYLLKDILGPTLKQIVKDGYALAKKQIGKRLKEKKALEKKAATKRRGRS